MKRILVVDDIVENRYLLQAMLQAYGFEVVSAGGGEDALSHALRQPPDLVISDILMPVMDGFTLCRRWRAEEPLRRIPFILYSATYTDAQDEQLALDLGADRFVIKPQEPQAMFAIIQEVLARGRMNPAAAVAPPPPPIDEIATLREYNEALVRKLGKKVTELEASRETLEAEIGRRCRVEVDLRRSEERWRLIYETEPECVKVISSTGRLVDMNPAGLAMIDADSLEEARRKPLLDLIAPEHRDAFLALHENVIAGQSGRLVFEIIGLKGTRRWLETHAAPMRHNDSMFLLGITQDITERRRAEDELRASRGRLKVLSRQLLDSQESERRHIARELHDQIGQSLTAIKLNLKALQPAVHATSAQTMLHETIDIVDQTLAQARNLSLELRPSMLDDLGLVAALRWYLDRQARRAGFSVQFAAESSDSGLSKEAETACFRVAQEIVTNIARHAHARNVRLELNRLETELELLVQDDGVGFDLIAAHERAARGTSLGLVGVQERVSIVGGSLEIQSEPSRGTRVRVRFPLTPTVPGSEWGELKE